MKFFLLNNLDDQINNFLSRNGRFVELSCRTSFSIVRLCQDIIGNHLTVMKFVEEIIIFIDIHYKKNMQLIVTYGQFSTKKLYHTTCMVNH